MPTPIKTPKTPGKTEGDRFIPARNAMDMEISQYLMENKAPVSPSREEYREKLAASLFDGKLNKDSKILAFRNKAPSPKKQTVLYTASAAPKTVKSSRFIPQNPEKILDAPSIVDDFYLNLLDWSNQNVLAISLANTVYLWDAASGSISELVKTPENVPVTSVAWTQEGAHVAVGTDNGEVTLFDAAQQKALRKFSEHGGRVGSLSWNKHLLSTGCRDGVVRNFDVRVRDALMGSFANHTNEVCGLKWSVDGSQLASGGNDNLVNIWSLTQSNPRFTFSDHRAAVKAVAWCPYQRDLLATGGGTSDGTIRFWNTTTGACVNSINTGSQVSGLLWSKNSTTKEIVSSHGFSDNQLCVWKYPTLVKVGEMRGHEQRILSIANSPDGRMVVSASADETLRFWKVFDAESAAQPVATLKAKESESTLKTKAITIR